MWYVFVNYKCNSVWLDCHQFFNDRFEVALPTLEQDEKFVFSGLEVLFVFVVENLQEIRSTFRVCFSNKLNLVMVVWLLAWAWASAPMGKTRHLPSPGIWHLRSFRYKIANLNKNFGMKRIEIAFCPVQNIFCPPQKIVLRTPMAFAFNGLPELIEPLFQSRGRGIDTMNCVARFWLAAVMIWRLKEVSKFQKLERFIKPKSLFLTAKLFSFLVQIHGQIFNRELITVARLPATLSYLRS